MRRQLLTGLLMTIAMIVVLGLLYPLAMTGAAQLFAKNKANGSFVTKNGKVVGSSLIGQAFTDKDGNPIPRYFQSRPSYAGTGYDVVERRGATTGRRTPTSSATCRESTSTRRPTPTATEPIRPASRCRRPTRTTTRSRTVRESRVREEQGRHLRLRSEHRARAGAGVPTAQRSEPEGVGAGRRRYLVGLGARPRDLGRERSTSGAAPPGPAAFRSRASSPSWRRTPRTANSAYWARRPSTC